MPGKIQVQDEAMGAYRTLRASLGLPNPPLTPLLTLVDRYVVASVAAADPFASVQLREANAGLATTLRDLIKARIDAGIVE